MAKIEELESEIARVKAKLDAIDDPDIQGALELKLESLIAALRLEKNAEEERQRAEQEVEPVIEMSQKEIDDQVRQARGHLQTNKRGAATDIVNLLLKAAPDNVDVLELRGDIAIAAKDYPTALKHLKKARELAPLNVNVEKKLAHVALQTTVLGSLEDQLRAEEAGVLIGDGDMKASATAATLLSAICPGAGHIALGQSKKGAIYLTVWVIAVAIIVVLAGQENAKNTGSEHGFQFSMPMIGVGFVGLMVYMTALLEIAAIGKTTTKRMVVSHPKPPVDLPYE